MSERIAVVGLGYVGLPVALAFAAKFPDVLGFDIDASRIAALEQGHDWTGECARDALEASTIAFTADPADLAAANFYIVAVPTPIDSNRRPDLGPIESASRTVGAGVEDIFSAPGGASHGSHNAHKLGLADILNRAK